MSFNEAYKFLHCLFLHFILIVHMILDWFMLLVSAVLLQSMYLKEVVYGGVGTLRDPEYLCE